MSHPINSLTKRVWLKACRSIDAAPFDGIQHSLNTIWWILVKYFYTNVYSLKIFLSILMNIYKVENLVFCFSVICINFHGAFIKYLTNATHSNQSNEHVGTYYFTKLHLPSCCVLHSLKTSSQKILYWPLVTDGKCIGQKCSFLKDSSFGSWFSYVWKCKNLHLWGWNFTRVSHG